MAKSAKLTALEVKTAPPGRHNDGAGLCLLVRPNGWRGWLFRFKLGGRAREMGLGPAAGTGAVSLATARAEAAKHRAGLANGIDPLVAKEAKAAAAKAAAQVEAIAAITFRAVCDAYISAHAAGWKNPKHKAQWASTLSAHVCPHFGEVSVAEVGTEQVLAALQPIWALKPETASRVRGRVEAVLDFAKARGWRTGENPARWRGHLDHVLPARNKVRSVEHHPALPWQEVGAFMVALAARDGMGARALRFAILTAARSGEVRGAAWGEIDMEAATWTVPAARMKAGVLHRVPLAAAAMSLLREMATLRRSSKAEDLVFPGARSGRPLSDMSLTAVLRRMGRGDLTAHGFRSSFRDWAAETTNYPRELAEAALAHTVGDRVEAAYRRGDLFMKRRELMEAWSAFCGRYDAQPSVRPAGASPGGDMT